MCQSIEKLESVKMRVAKVYTRTEIDRGPSFKIPRFCVAVYQIPP
jgi:hypothetical protein